MNKKKRFAEFNLQSEANRFDWILNEASRVRRVLQAETRGIYRSMKEAELAFKRPVWAALDERMNEHEEGARLRFRK